MSTDKSTEPSSIFGDTDKSKGSSSLLSSFGKFGRFPLNKQCIHLNFSPVKPNPDYDHDFGSSSRPQQHDTLGSNPEQAEKQKAAICGPSFSKPRQVQDRKIKLSGPSGTPVKEMKDTNISQQSLTKPEKVKMNPSDVPDEPNPDEDTADGNGKNLDIAGMLRSFPPGEALKSTSSSPRKVMPSASVRSSRPLPHLIFEREPAVPAHTTNVSIHAEVARSASQLMLDTSQSRLARLFGTPLLSTSQNAGPVQKDGQTAAQKSLRSSLRNSINSGWTSIKSSAGSTFNTVGRSLSRSTRRRPQSTAGSVLGEGSQERSTAGCDKRNKKDKKSSPAFDTVFTPCHE